jgi:small subunit ribosomal protein S3
LGRKVHPYGFRIGVIKDWQTRWFAEGKEYAQLLNEDRALRDLVQREIPNAGISKIEIERSLNQIRLIIHTAKPGIIIGRKGASVNALRQALQDRTNMKKVKIDVVEIERPELDAYLVAQSIAEQLEQRVSYKRAMKQAVAKAIKMGAQGAMITCGGRLAGSEMARRETVREGRIPRHTFRADIDFARAEALTTFGRIGIKVWIYKGDVLGPPPLPAEVAEVAAE